MKKISIIIVLFLLSLINSYSKELLNLSFDNRSGETGNYKTDLMIEVSGANWEIGPTTIIIKYNSIGLSHSKNLSNIDNELQNAGYYISKTQYSDDEIAINVMPINSQITKSAKFRLCTIEFGISDGDLMDNLAFNSDETVIYNNISEMVYNCTSSNCYNFTNPKSLRIIPRMSAPDLISPTNSALKVNLFVDFDWKSIADANIYELLLSSNSSFSDTIIHSLGSNDFYNLNRGTLDYNKTYYWKVRATNDYENSYWSSVWSFSTRSPLSKPQNLSPDNLATNIKLLPEFTFDDVTDANTYLIQISTINDFSSTLVNTEITDNYYKIVNKFNYNSKYYWRVKAKDNYGEESEWSNICEFTTKSRLSTPTLQTPLNDAQNIVLTPTLIWNSLDGANGYRLLISKVIDFSNFVYDVSQTSSQYTIATNLEEKTKYYWKVVAWDSDGDSSNYSTVFNFTTKSLLVQLSNLKPVNNSIDEKLQPTFSFDPLENADSYQIQVSINSDMSSPLLDKDITQNQLICSEKLNYLNDYYWRARAKTSGGDLGPWSDILKFTTKEKLSQPITTTPADNSTEQELNLEFTWQKIEKASAYVLQVSKDNSFSEIVGKYNTSNIFYTLNNTLEVQSKYYWRVKAWDSDGDSSEYSATKQFTTKQLKAPALSTPTHYSNFIALSSNFTWGTSEYADSYRIQISRTSDFSVIDFESTVTGTAYTPSSNLISGKKYYWRVLAKKSSKESEWSSINEFSTTFDITLLKPTNNSVNIVRSNIEFECQANDLVEFYIFQVAKSSSFTDIVFETTSSSNKLTYNYLNRKTKFYWRVRPKIGTEYGNWSSIWNFTTEEFNGPTLSSPSNSTIDWNPPFDLSWVTNSEATKGYDIQISQNSSFSDYEYEKLGNSSNSINISDLERGIKYYWRVRNVNNYESSAWSTVWNFTTNIYSVPSDWEPSITSKTHSVRVPSTINPQIVGRALRKGDVIGTFYKDGTSYKCCGYIVWNKITAYITVYGDDPETTAKEGYSVGDTLKYKLFNCLTNNTYDALVKYSSGPVIFTLDATSALSELKTAEIKQDIYMTKGWNMVSSNLNLYDNDIPDIWSGYSTNLLIMKNVTGSFYIPGKIDQLKKWNKKYGYQVYMNLSDKLTLTGSDLLPDTVNISLSNGWAIVSYLRNSELDVPTALATIKDNLLIAKDNTGKFYLPSSGMNTIGNMKVGQGYKLYMKAADILTYPANSGSKRAVEEVVDINPKLLLPEYTTTGNNSTLILTINAPNFSEIGVYNSNGKLVGSGVVYEAQAGINIIGDDQMTESLDGCLDNESLTLKLVLPGEKNLQEIQLQAIENIIENKKLTELKYGRDQVICANSKINNFDNTDALTLYPNPVGKILIINLNTEAQNENIKIEIFDELGKTVYSTTAKLDSSGKLNYEFNTSELTSGLYYVKISNKNIKLNDKFIKK